MTPTVRPLNEGGGVSERGQLMGHLLADGVMVPSGQGLRSREIPAPSGANPWPGREPGPVHQHTLCAGSARGPRPVTLQPLCERGLPDAVCAAWAAWAACSRSLSFLLLRRPLTPPFWSIGATAIGLSVESGTARGSKPSTVSRGTRSPCRFSIRRKWASASGGTKL